MTLLDDLTKALDARQSTYTMLDSYYDGRQPLAYLSSEARDALDNRLTSVAVNVPRLLVDALAERLRVTGFDGAEVWPAWLANDLDQQSGIVHREALTLGQAYVIVWADDSDQAMVTAESAHQVVTLHDPGSRRITAALKRWTTEHTTEAALFTPDKVTRLRADVTGATAGSLQVVRTMDNPLGMVPVVRFANRSRLLSDGRSEMADVLALTDALVKLTTDMLVSSEYTARPRRWATGIELEEDENGEATNPIPEGDRAMISENPDAKFGQLPGSDLGGYENAVGVIMRQISAVSGLPEHLLGIGGDNPSAEGAIRASEAALTARAEAKQKSFGRSWEQVARLMAAVGGTSADEVRTRWADPSTRSQAQEADAITKLFSSGLLPASYALRKLGYSEDEIAEIRTARRLEALDAVPVEGVDRG